MSDQKTALVTGASTGIGEATALRLVREGWRVWATVRDEADGADLSGRAEGWLRPLLVDVTRGEDIEAARQQVEEAGGLDAVIANAGIGIAGPLELLTDDELREQFEVNVIGYVSVARSMLDLLRRSDRGRIIFVSSIGGKAAFPFAGAYNASMFAIEAIGDSLRTELEPEGIEVVLIEPPAISTPIWEKAIDRIDEMKLRDGVKGGIYAERLDRFRDRLGQLDRGGDDPDKVAETIVRALASQSPSARYPVGLRARVVGPVRSVLPDAVFDRFAGRAT